MANTDALEAIVADFRDNFDEYNSDPNFVMQSAAVENGLARLTANYEGNPVVARIPDNNLSTMEEIVTEMRRLWIEGEYVG